jgi:hypothetical protein
MARGGLLLVACITTLKKRLESPGRGAVLDITMLLCLVSLSPL